ncbi:O-antigen ligase family protein [Silanimonas lenta]|uniref:O-antigen ligase family protein n=1 Tax=Silanimonas lenta TaxID=265429 RepID=UPI002FE162BF
MRESLLERLPRLAPWWVLLQVACWPWRGLAEAVLSLGALLGFGLMLAARFRGGMRVLSHEAWALTSILFLGYWLAQLVSVPFALDPGVSALEVLKDLRYLPFLWLVAMAMATPRGRGIVGLGLGALVAFWTADALAQAATGHSLGGPALADRLSGIFGAGNLKLGLVLASLSPFLLLPAARRGVLPWLLAAGALGVVILLAGARAAWITYGLVLLVTGLGHWGWRRTGAGLLGGGALALLLAWSAGDFLAPRIERSLAVLQGQEDGLDFALSGRLVLWRTTLAIIRDHPLTGVGVDNFQQAYRAYASPDDQFVEWGRPGAFHAHQILLEILAETGLLGLLCWLAAVAVALRAWRYAGAEAKARAAAPALALAVTVFPLNTHLAFYSTFWGGLTLLLAALYAGALAARAPATGVAPEGG